MVSGSKFTVFIVKYSSKGCEIVLVFWMAKVQKLGLFKTELANCLHIMNMQLLLITCEPRMLFCAMCLAREESLWIATHAVLQFSTGLFTHTFFKG